MWGKRLGVMKKGSNVWAVAPLWGPNWPQDLLLRVNIKRKWKHVIPQVLLYKSWSIYCLITVKLFQFNPYSQKEFPLYKNVAALLLIISIVTSRQISYQLEGKIDRFFPWRPGSTAICRTNYTSLWMELGFYTFAPVGGLFSISLHVFLCRVLSS